MSSRSVGEPGASAPGSSCDPAAPADAPSPAALPAELGAVDAATRAALTLASAAHEWDAASRAAVLTWVARHRDAVAVLEARVLTAEREAGTWSLRGDRDLAGFLGRASHQGRGAGLTAVGQAGTLAAMPAVAEALMDGPVTTTHVAQLTRATAASPTLATELGTPQGQARVVEMAGRLDGAEFGKALSQLAASLDPAGRQRAHDEQRAARSFAWTHTPSGTLLKGRLDTVAGHTLAKAIDALCPRPAVEDDRSREQRQADALVAIAQRVVTDRATTPGAVAPVQAIVTFTPETWRALRAARSGDDGADPSASTEGADLSAGAARSGDEGADLSASTEGAELSAGAAGACAEERSAPAPGSAQDVMGRLRGVGPVVDETGQAWPASEIARALCDCLLTRAVVGGRDAELNLGRGERRFGRQHWLALYAAGARSCSIGGCGMPLAYTELHHLRWWTRDGGPTDLANCAAYCSFHHHEIHRLGIVATRLADGTLEHRYPDGRPYGEATASRPPGTHQDGQATVDRPLSTPDGAHGRGLARPSGTSGRPSNPGGPPPDPGERTAGTGGGPGSIAELPADPSERTAGTGEGLARTVEPPASTRESSLGAGERPPADLLELLTG